MDTIHFLPTVIREQRTSTTAMRRALEARRAENGPVCPSGTEGTRAELAARAKAQVIHTQVIEDGS